MAGTPTSKARAPGRHVDRLQSLCADGGGTAIISGMLRNARLERLLGGRIDERLTYEQVKSLIPAVAESVDLEFKRDAYSSSDRDKKSLDVDTTALANAGGGLIILGMDEDDQARAMNDVGVDISDAEQRRMLQVLYSSIQPTPNVTMLPIEDSTRPGTGFLLISVAPSASAPHAYLQNKSLIYPKRIGAQIVHLSEGEVAESYRARFAGLAARADAAEQIKPSSSPGWTTSRSG